MIPFHVPLLPHRDLKAVGGRKRRQAPYSKAHEELRAATALAMAEAGDAPESPYNAAHVVVVCHVAKKHGDGRYRPRTVPTMLRAIDPIYRAILDQNVVRKMADIRGVSGHLFEGEPEGFTVFIEEFRA